MKRSTDRILTTHVGSLPRPDDLRAMILQKQQGQTVDEAAFAARVKSAVAETVHRQALAMRRKLLGSEHKDVADSLRWLSPVLRDQGKLAEAEAVQRAARHRRPDRPHPLGLHRPRIV